MLENIITNNTKYAILLLIIQNSPCGHWAANIPGQPISWLGIGCPQGVFL
jgi:hypothetical protein